MGLSNWKDGIAMRKTAGEALTQGNQELDLIKFEASVLQRDMKWQLDAKI